MIRDITLGQYFPGNSPIHRLDPRSKLVLVFALLIIIFLCQNFFSLALITVFSVVCVLLSRIPFKTMMKGLKTIVFVILLTSILQIF